MVLNVRDEEGQLVAQTEKRTDSSLVGRDWKVGENRDLIGVGHHAFVRDYTAREVQSIIYLELRAGKGDMKFLTVFKDGVQTGFQLAWSSSPN